MNKWTDETIETGIREVMQENQIESMPTNSLIQKTTGNYALSEAIQKHGGFKFWANKMGLSMTTCETRFGQYFESICMADLISMGYECEKASTKYPYDILANGVKIDVKSSCLYVGRNGSFYTFNLEKTKPTCDIYIAYCTNKEKEIRKTYVIPAIIVQGKTQLSIGEHQSRYDKYLENWEIVGKYNEFFNSILECI